MAEGQGAAARWGDLGARIGSAAVLAAIAVAALFSGTLGWGIVLTIVAGLMLWELAALCEPGIAPWRRGVLAASVLLSVALLRFPMVSVFPAFVPSILGIVLLSHRQALWFAYAWLISFAAITLHLMPELYGPWAVLAMIGLVVIGDTVAYFAGRTFGGPKFWPRISPKKTWSGTVAAWIACGLYGAVIFPMWGLHWYLGVLAFVPLCFAGQMGDIAESAIKRRAGVKDSAHYIPGHGGFLDRMDAMIAVAALAGLILLIGKL